MNTNKTTNVALTITAALLAVDIATRLGVPSPAAHAQSDVGRHPIDLSAAPTRNDNFLLYRMWSDGSIDVRLVNPLNTQAVDWPKSDKAGISFQEKWKVFQEGP
jgi:hypothetical protein